MKVVAFCGALSRARDFRRAFAGSGHTLLFVTCADGPVALAKQAARLLIGAGPADWIYLLEAFVAGRILWRRSLTDPGVAAFLERHRPDVGLHAMGTIYRREMMDRCGAGILNAHIGALPRYRGRSVMEWTLLCGDETGVTVFVIDEGIDTGQPIVLFEAVSVDERPDLDSAKRRLFAQDARLYRQAVDRLASGAALSPNDTSQGLRFYEMSSLFRGVLQDWRNETASPS